MGSLGLLDLKVFGCALWLRWVWFSRADQGRIWAPLPTTDDPVMVAFFRASTFHEIGNGANILFWKDAWVDGCSIAQMAPELVVVVLEWKQKWQLLVSALDGEAWTGDISGALTMPALVQYLQIRSRIQGTQLHPSRPDKIIWRWTASGLYSSASTY
jgi:hypothetical protein